MSESPERPGETGGAGYKLPPREQRREIIGRVLADKREKRQQAADHMAQLESSQSKEPEKIVPLPLPWLKVAMGLAAMLVLGFVLFFQFRPASYAEFAMETRRGVTNDPANADKLQDLLHPVRVAPGPIAPPRPAILVLLPDFQKLTVTFKLPDDSELAGSLTPLPIAGVESDTVKFRIAAKGATKSGTTVEVEGDLEVTSTKAVKTAGELRWKHISSARVMLTKPALSALAWSRP